MKKLLKFASLSITTLAPAPFLVACANEVPSSDLLIQRRKVLENFDTFSNNQLWDAILTSQYSDSLNGDTLENAFNDINTKYFSDAWNAFDYYQNHTLNKDKLYFVKKVNEWAGLGLLTQDGSSQSNIETFEELNLEYGQTLTKDQFKLIWKNPDTKIQEQVKKMLLAKDYLTNSTEENIKKSKEWQDNSNNSSDTNEYLSVSTKNKDFFLNVNLLKKQISDVWEFNSTEASALATFSKFRIKNVENFNLLSRTKISLVTKKQSSNIALATNDSLDVSQLFAYKGLQANSSKEGDLSYTIPNLKKQDKIFSGFLDNATSKIYSLTDFQKSSIFKDKKELIPHLLEASRTKDKFTIAKEDFVLTGGSFDIKYEISAVYPDNSSTTNNKQAIVLVKMSQSSNPSQTHLYRVLVNWNESEVRYSPSIGNDVPQVNTSVSVLAADNKSIKASYINKITPLATELIITGEGESRRIDVYFSLEKTPWSSEEQKTRLSFALALLDDTILTSALAFYKDLGFKIDQKNVDIFGK